MIELFEKIVNGFQKIGMKFNPGIAVEDFASEQLFKVVNVEVKWLVIRQF